MIGLVTIAEFTALVTLVCSRLSVSWDTLLVFSLSHFSFPSSNYLRP